MPVKTYYVVFINFKWIQGLKNTLTLIFLIWMTVLYENKLSGHLFKVQSKYFLRLITQAIVQYFYFNYCGYFHIVKSYNSF